MMNWKLSLPPRRISALPDFNINPLHLAATFGLDSYITPITPNGIDTFSIFNPFGLDHSPKFFPTGSSKMAIFPSPMHILSILLSLT